MTRTVVCVLAACCASPGPTTPPPVGNRQRIVIEHPQRPGQLVVAVDLAAGEQVEWQTPACGDGDISPQHWRDQLQKLGFTVQLGSWDTIAYFGVRFLRDDGLYGDLYSAWSGSEGKVCGNYTIRLQRSAIPGKPEPWKTQFGIHSDNDPTFYFAADPRFPTGY